MTDPKESHLQRFLHDFVESLEDLLILAWFRYLEKGTLVTASEVVRATGVPDLMVREVLERLVAKGLLAATTDAPAEFRYAPPSGEFSATLDVVLEHYRANSMDVLRMMSANSIERVRATAMRTLAEVLRGRGPKGD
jgi:sugar-specific transcriptional regulator TrmB